MNTVWRRTAAAVMLVGLATGCLDAFDPPPGTHEFDPPDFYGGLWAGVEQCSGLRGDMSRVTWHRIPEWDFRCGDRFCFGTWRNPHRIYLSEFALQDSASNFFTVRHEMLHDLHGEYEHPPVFRECGLMRYYQ